MNPDIHIDIFSVIIFLGVFLGLILSSFFIFKPSPNIKANRCQGLLLLSLSLIFLEQVLNFTGYIVKVLPLTYSTAWMNFLIGPFLYLYVKRSLDLRESKKEWTNFILPLLYLIYLIFSLVQSNEFKYNSYISSSHLNLPLLDVHSTIPNDPLKINKYLDLVMALQVLFYISLSLVKLIKKSAEAGTSVFRITDDVLRSVRDVILHMCMIILIFIIVKIALQGNAGNYFIGTYVAVFALLTTFRVMNDSTYFDRSASFLDISIGKYRKSSLTESGKMKILDSITTELDTKHYYSDNLASLSELARKIGESPHHVSQVINEKLNQSFFELLASYRVEEAKRILLEDKTNKLTVEEISEIVGYNSKTAFNNAFKKLTGKTPSEFRKYNDQEI
jgi:AraC-like DNA-binding protein